MPTFRIVERVEGGLRRTAAENAAQYPSLFPSFRQLEGWSGVRTRLGAAGGLLVMRCPLSGDGGYRLSAISSVPLEVEEPQLVAIDTGAQAVAGDRKCLFHGDFLEQRDAQDL
jgi:hypothetical protein